MKISIIGASGFIGKSLFEYLSEEVPTGSKVTGTYCENPHSHLRHLDITKGGRVKTYLAKTVPDYVIFLAGSKDVTRCEADPTFSYEMNAAPIHHLIHAIRDNHLKTRVLLFSTDYVFRGKCGHYEDTAKPIPVTNYGKSKLIAEEEIIKSGIECKIIRTGAVMGRGASFYDWLVSALHNDEQISLFNNVSYSPTPIMLLNEITLKIILNYGKIPEKILHLVGDQQLSRYDFGLMVQSILHKRDLIVPEHIDLTSSIFQRDLSLTQSNFVRQYQTKNLTEYLKLELER